MMLASSQRRSDMRRSKFTLRVLALSWFGMALVLVYASTNQTPKADATQKADAKSFADQLGDVKVGTVDATGAIQVPYITWGGDVATFIANGGLKTTKDSIYGKLSLNLTLK